MKCREQQCIGRHREYRCPVQPDQPRERQEVERLFTRYAEGTPLRFLETNVEESIPSLLAPELSSASVVVAVGGDGTVSGTAAALLGTGIPLGIVPAGSTNMLAKVNKVPLDTEGAVRLITGEHWVDEIDAGVSGDRVLLHLGGAGLDARIFQRSSTSLKRRFKWLGYAPSAVRSLQDAGAEVSISVDGSTINVRTRMVLVANSGSVIHPRFTVLPTASRSDGIFEVGIFTADSLPEIALTLSDLTVMRWRSSPRLIQLRGSDIRVEATPDLPFEFDGDVIGTTPFSLTVRQKAVRIICGP